MSKPLPSRYQVLPLIQQYINRTPTSAIFPSRRTSRLPYTEDLSASGPI